ncbi:hypothetical protein ACSLBF_21090 (plasmid) [Pseudoalteromonas sp. T1lg65]|uniref:hypothetical protein n=1 Tax=Pseudoalteromonas sp. T1lg65 TaxID=2077101 RepID=UPI003F79A636
MKSILFGAVITIAALGAVVLSPSVTAGTGYTVCEYTYWWGAPSNNRPPSTDNFSVQYAGYVSCPSTNITPWGHYRLTAQRYVN